jgi:hypothetical protein
MVEQGLAALSALYLDPLYRVITCEKTQPLKVGAGKKHPRADALPVEKIKRCDQGKANRRE